MRLGKRVCAMMVSYASRRAMFMYSKLGSTSWVCLVGVLLVVFIFLRLHYRIELLGELLLVRIRYDGEDLACT